MHDEQESHLGSKMIHNCFLVWTTWIMRESGRFAYKSFHLQVDSPTLKSIRLQDLRCFAYTVVDSTPGPNPLTDMDPPDQIH